MFLTTDDDLVRRAGRLTNEIRTMIPLENMSDEDFERHALAVLQRELGLDEYCSLSWSSLATRTVLATLWGGASACGGL
jgi:hypothetical protein